MTKLRNKTLERLEESFKKSIQNSRIRLRFLRDGRNLLKRTWWSTQDPRSQLAFTCSKLIMETRCWICSKLMTCLCELEKYLAPCSSVSIVKFVQVNAGWESSFMIYIIYSTLEMENRNGTKYSRADWVNFVEDSL